MGEKEQSVEPTLVKTMTETGSNKKHKKKGKHHHKHNGTDTSEADISSLRKDPVKSSKASHED